MSVAQSAEQASEWAGLLDPGERIIWQGRPSPRPRIEFRNAFEPLSFLFLIGFSVFWMVTATRRGDLSWTFGLLFFAVGAYHLLGIHFWKAYLRGHTHYSLTNRRAIIATDVLGRRRLRSYPINASTELEFDAGSPGSIYFAKSHESYGKGIRTVPIGFEMIADARDVMALLRRVQEGAA